MPKNPRVPSKGAPNGGRILRVLMERKGLKRKDFGIDQQNFTNWDRGRPIKYFTRKFEALSNTLKINPEILRACLLEEIHPDEIAPPTPQHKRNALPIEWVEALYPICDESPTRIDQVLQHLRDKMLAERQIQGKIDDSARD